DMPLLGLPKSCRVVVSLCGVSSEFVVIAVKNERLPTLETGAVPGEHSLCRLLRVPAFDGDQDARAKPDKVVRVRKQRRLIKVVQPPNEAAFNVAPCAEVFDMDVADTDDQRRPRLARAKLRECLRPPVERRAQKREVSGRHFRVLVLEVAAV